MGLYIDNGKTVKHYCTNNKIEKAIETLVEQMQEICYLEIYEGYEVVVRRKDDESEQ